MDLTLGKEQGKDVVVVSHIHRRQLVHCPEQPLAYEVAHEVLVRRTDGTGQPQHADLPHEREVQSEQQVAEAGLILKRL